MLLNIPQCFTPELLAVMMEMGHGEKLLISDANFPTHCCDGRALYFTGFKVADLLGEILRFFPLDSSVEFAATVMESARESDVFERYGRLVENAPAPSRLEAVPRFDFYDKAKDAVAVIVTSDTVKGGNILIQKGVVR